MVAPFVLNDLLADPLFLFKSRSHRWIQTCGKWLNVCLPLDLIREVNLVLKWVEVLILCGDLCVNLGPGIVKLDLFDHALGAQVVSAAPFHSAEAAPEWVHALDCVSRRRRVGHTKRAVHSAAIVGGSAPRVPVARLAEVSVAAPEERLRAAQVALPGDVLVPVLLAVELATADLLDGAARAAEVLLAGGVGKLQVALAVNKAAVERLLAAVALVEGALGQNVLVRLVVELAACLGNGCHVDLALGLELLGECQDVLLELQELVQVGVELRALLEALDGRLAGGAGEELKRDAEGAPLVAEEVTDALGVEDVAAAELDRWVRAQLAREANVAQVVLVGTGVSLAFGLEAGQALGLVGDTAAGMAASLVDLLAGRDLCWHLDWGWLRLPPAWAQEVRAEWLPVDNISAARVRIASLGSVARGRGVQ